MRARRQRGGVHVQRQGQDRPGERHRHREDEGQGVVAEGTLQGDGSMVADTVLAKHDEKYMPKDVADKLKEKGVWQEGQTTTQ